MKLRLLAAVFALSLLWPARTIAADAALAEALFQEAKQLADAGKYAEACPKFEASYRADRTLGTLLNLAHCHEQIGKVATAWAEWNEAIEMAKRAGDERVGFATERRDALSPRLPKLEVRVRGSASDLSVHRDEQRILPAAYGSAIPTDPGSHELSVRRGEVVLTRQTLTFSEGKTEVVELDLDAIARAHPPQPAGGPAGAAGGPMPNGPRDGGTSGGGSAQKTIGFIVGGVGVTALITAGAFELVALINKNEADEPDRCVNKYCSPQGLESAERARDFAEAGQWVGIGGLVLTAVGVTLVLTAPSPEKNTAKLGVTPWLGPSGAGLGVTGEL